MWGWLFVLFVALSIMFSVSLHIDSLLLLVYDSYSPNIKEIKVLDKKKVRRAKLYYLRDKMNALKKQ